MNLPVCGIIFSSSFTNQNLTPFVNNEYGHVTKIIRDDGVLSEPSRVQRDSVVKCLTRNPGVLGSSLTASSGFFRGSVLEQDTSEPSLVLVKLRKA